MKGIRRLQRVIARGKVEKCLRVYGVDVKVNREGKVQRIEARGAAADAMVRAWIGYNPETK